MPKISIVGTIDLIIILISLWLIHWDTSDPLSRVKVQTTTNNRFACYVCIISWENSWLAETTMSDNMDWWKVLHVPTAQWPTRPPTKKGCCTCNFSFMVQCCVHTFETLSHFDKSQILLTKLSCLDIHDTPNTPMPFKFMPFMSNIQEYQKEFLKQL